MVEVLKGTTSDLKGPVGGRDRDREAGLREGPFAHTSAFATIGPDLLSAVECSCGPHPDREPFPVGAKE